MRVRLQAATMPVALVSEHDRDRLFNIFHRYYAHVTRVQFDADFFAKDHVILLRSPDHVVQGFSTLRNLELTHRGKRVRLVFSGDTVVEKEFWGQGTLGVEFLKYLFKQMLRAPLTPLYWFLISKGYKTYLLMANNFDEHWPRHEEATPQHEHQLMQQAATTLFGDNYDHECGLVRFAKSPGHLKRGVASVSDDLRDRNPRVDFFVQRNPTWLEGSELVCLARMRWSMPFSYWLKIFWKDQRHRRSSKSKTTRSDAVQGTP